MNNVQETQTKNEVKVVKDVGQSVVNNLLAQVESFASIEATPLNNLEKKYAVSIIERINKEVNERNIRWADLDIIGCSLPDQIKSYARLGLSIQEKEIYIDIRHNSKTNKKDISILKQYQGVEKEIVKWCRYKVIRFVKDVVCEGDNLIERINFATGNKEIVNHEKNFEVDRNKMENIKGAYQIAYCLMNDGSIAQFYTYIDRNRIDRAYNASPSREKAVWKQDTLKMVLKTATWELYNTVLKPFMNIPEELKNDWEKTNSEMQFNVKVNSVEQLENKVSNGVATEDFKVVDVNENN